MSPHNSARIIKHADESPPADRLLSLRSLSNYSGLSPRTLRDHLHNPICPLPHFRVGGKILIRQSEFNRWIEHFRARKTIAVDTLVNDVLQTIHSQVTRRPMRD